MERNMDQENLSSTQPVSQQRPGIPSLLISVFTSPSSVFGALTGKTVWIIPFVIIVIIGATIASPGGYFIRPIMSRDLYPAVLKNIERYQAQMGEEQFNQVKAKIDESFKEAIANPFKWYYLLTYSGLPFVILIVIAAICIISGNFLFGGKSSFWIVMNVVVFAALIGTLGDAIRGILVMLKDSISVYTGLGLLKPTDDGSFLFYLFRQVDIFSIWRILVTAIGLGAIYNMKPKRFAYVLFSVWIIFIVLVAFANIFTGGSILY